MKRKTAGQLVRMLADIKRSAHCRSRRTTAECPPVSDGPGAANAVPNHAGAAVSQHGPDHESGK